ncbi:hypothetical protein Tco_0367311 [Tanacetum coccineum]
MKNEGTAQVDEGTAKNIRKYCFYSKVLLIMLKVLLVVKVPLLCSKVLLVSSEKLVYTASFVRYRTERNFWFSDVKTISYSSIFLDDLNLNASLEFTVSQKMEYFVKRLRLTYISLEFTYNIDDTIGVDSARP